MLQIPADHPTFLQLFPCFDSVKHLILRGLLLFQTLYPLLPPLLLLFTRHMR